ncbi:unnamed protein product [Urochloa humidicola]
MASTLLRTSALRGSAFRRAVSAAAADVPCVRRGERLPAPLRRLSSHSGSSGVEPPSLDEKVNLLRRSIEELNSKVDKRYLISASLQKYVEEKKLLNPFVQWSWQVGVVTLIVLAERWMGSEKQDN